MESIASRLQDVLARIDVASGASGRDRVRLLAVSKGQPAAAIRAAFAAGQRAFAENYVQEALAKMDELRDLAIEWHFIGPIQSNKTKPIAERFAWVHSIERFNVAERLSKARPDHLPALDVCLQTNISGEASKSGVAPGELAMLAKEVAALPRLRLRGLMTIPAPAKGVEAQHEPFRRLAALLRDLNRAGASLDTLSMGMSDDFAAAIAEGATIVRVGTAIFGKRRKKLERRELQIQ